MLLKNGANETPIRKASVPPLLYGNHMFHDKIRNVDWVTFIKAVGYKCLEGKDLGPIAISRNYAILDNIG